MDLFSIIESNFTLVTKIKSKFILPPVFQRDS